MRTRSRGVSICAGPNHADTWSGSVHARNTRSRGASKTCVIRTSRSPATASLISFSLRAQVRVESVHACFPRLLPRLHPLDGLVERVGLQAARAPLGLLAANDQARALEHLEMPRYRGQAHLERLRQLADRRLALGQAREDGATRGIGEGGEGSAEVVGGHLTRMLNNEEVKYKCG